MTGTPSAVFQRRILLSTPVKEAKKDPFKVKILVNSLTILATTNVSNYTISIVLFNYSTLYFKRNCLCWVIV